MLSYCRPRLCLADGGGPATDGAGLKISAEDLLREPTVQRVQSFLLQFSDDHEVSPDEVAIIARVYRGLPDSLARTLQMRAKILIDRFGPDESRGLARETGLL